MDLKQLRQRCEARLRDLDLPVPFDVDAFCESLAARRGRPVVLRPLVSKAGPWGLWVAGAAADFIFYEQETSTLHQEHIILHEASHLLCHHDPRPVSEAEFSRQLLPDLDPEVVRSVLRRAAYSAEEEREAEVLASLILERAGRSTAANRRPTDPEVAALLDRLGHVLEQPEEGPDG